MILSTFEFSLHPPETLSGNALDRRHKELDALIRPLAERNARGDWEVDLDSPKLHELVRILERLHKTKAAWMSFVGIEERFLEDAKTRAAWYLLEPKRESHLDMCFLRHLLDEELYPFGNAKSAKPGAHVALWGLDAVLVSERFKGVVETERLAGLDFLWVRCTARYQAPQWYLALPRECLGRGLDHTWYDPSKSTGAGSDAKDPRARHGQRLATSLAGFTLRAKASFGDSRKDRLLKLAVEMSKKRMVVSSYPRYLRQHLPRADFAFTLDDCQYDDAIDRRRGLAVSRRARDLLVAKGIVNDDEFVAVRVFDRAPPGVENLDRLYGKPEPLFSPDEFVRIREQEARFWTEHIRHAKPPRVPSLARSLSLLRAAKRRSSKRFPRPAAAKAIAQAERALGLEIPAAWQKVLRTSNGGKIAKSPLAAEQACLMVAVDRLPQAQREEVEYYREINAPLPKGWLLIVQTQTADSIWLDLRQKGPNGDCPVVLMSHETGEAEREWTSVAEFLEELVTAAPD
jgi:hypothetical protein